jgi:hypothetical protein
MTEIRLQPKSENVEDRVDPQTDRVVALPNGRRKGRHRYGGVLVGGSALLLLLAGLGIGGWRHYQAGLEVAATAQQSRTFVPNVRVAAVRASDSKITVSLPATTTAFEAANIFARTSGYIEKRYVDIGDRVKAGALLVDITAPSSTTRLRKPRRRWPRIRRRCGRPRQATSSPRSPMRATANWSNRDGSHCSRATTIA